MIISPPPPWERERVDRYRDLAQIPKEIRDDLLYTLMEYSDLDEYPTEEDKIEVLRRAVKPWLR